MYAVGIIRSKQYVWTRICHNIKSCKSWVRLNSSILLNDYLFMFQQSSARTCPMGMNKIIFHNAACNVSFTMDTNEKCHSSLVLRKNKLLKNKNKLYTEMVYIKIQLLTNLLPLHRLYLTRVESVTYSVKNKNFYANCFLIQFHNK